MVPNKVVQEYMAAGLRDQIESLAEMVREMEDKHNPMEAVSEQLEAVESRLRRLRKAA